MPHFSGAFELHIGFSSVGAESVLHAYENIILLEREQTYTERQEGHEPQSDGYYCLRLHITLVLGLVAIVVIVLLLHDP